MLSLKEMIGFEVKAEDGSAGRASDFLLDERDWTVGYAVLPTGGFLSGERLLVAVDDLTPTSHDRVLSDCRSLSELSAMSPKGLVTKAEEGWAAANNEASSHVPAGHAPEPRSPWRSFNAILGSNVRASDGGYGLLDDVLVGLDGWHVQYFVGRSYTWKKKPTVLIPTAWVKQVRWTGETVDVSVSLEALEREPSYKPASHAQQH